MRKTCHKLQYWYCEDGTWRMNSELSNLPATKKKLFKEGDSLEDVITQEKECILVVETQWVRTTLNKIQERCYRLGDKCYFFVRKKCRKSKKVVKKALKKIKK